MYRIVEGKPEIFLVHTGGPYHAKKDAGAWSFPKGLTEGDEDLLEAAKREFKEETSFDIPLNTTFIELGSVQRPDKIVHMWAFEGDCDLAKLKSNTCMVEWPPHSGKQIEIPEVDRGGFFTPTEAKIKLYPYLAPIIDEFEKKVR